MEIVFWHWLALGVLLLAIEVAVPSTFLLWPGIGALGVGLIALLLPMGAAVEALVFAAFSGVATIGWQLWLARNPIGSDRPILNRRMAQFVGRRVTLTEDMLEGRGTIHLGDTIWQVREEKHRPLATGAVVEITGAEGATLLIRRATGVG